MIQFESLEKSYGSLKVLEDINLRIPKGEIFGIVGPSGTGKSTLLRCINGLEEYQAGSLKVEGTEVKQLTPEKQRLLRKNIGMVFQNFSLLSRATVYDNIALAMEIWGVESSEIKERVQELLEVVQLEDKINSKARELSGGQKQRVAIARALAMRPSILLCDEATSALDPNSTNSIIRLLESINNQIGITIVMVTHEMEVVKNLCDSMAIINMGKVNAKGSVRDLFIQNPKSLREFMGEDDFVFPIEGITLELILGKEIENLGLLSKMARALDMDFRILKNEYIELKDNSVQKILINIADAERNKITQYLNDQKVLFKSLDMEEYK